MYSASRIIVSCLIGAHIVLVPVASGDPPSPQQVQRYQELHGRRFKELRGHVELAEYMGLRRIVLEGNVPTPENCLVYYALKGLGTPYKRRAQMFDLLHADCVSWMERVISLALTRNWEDAYRLQFRLRFKDGERTFVNLNQYPLADWLPNNSWLFTDVTEQLGVPVVPLEVFTDRRQKYVEHMASMGEVVDASTSGLSGPEISLTTPYIPRADMPAAYAHLQSGDIALFIADYYDRTEGTTRPRCIHEGIIYIHNGETRILHCVYPEAGNWLLERFVIKRIPPDRFLGVKFLRLRPGARGMVQSELAGRGMAAVTPAQKDRQFSTHGVLPNGTVLIRATRSPDEEIVYDGIVYGAIDISQGDSLWSLFTTKWHHVYNLDVNAAFRVAHPDPAVIMPAGEAGGVGRIYYPMRSAD